MSDTPSPSNTAPTSTDAITEETSSPAPSGKLDPISRKGTPAHRTRSKREGAGRRQGMPVQAISLSVPASLAAQWKTYSQEVPRSLIS